MGGKKADKRKTSKQAKPGKLGYREQLETLQLQLNAMARWLQHTGQRLAVVVEGRDTAGKGGVIAAIAETLNPRQCRVVALPRPSEREATQWYFQRYVAHLPAAGEIVLFDRSWYNRAGVEPVMGFCKPAQTAAFLKQAPLFERLLVDDGLLLLKYWLTVDQAQQEQRFAERAADPLKRWKLSPIDLKAREKYADYGRARDAMLEATHTRHAPWTLVDFNDQKRGRLALIRHLLDRLPDVTVPEEPVAFPPLPRSPLKERFTAGLKPIN
ncbi:MAG: polyphosphate kinase 2 [Burkholderiaceae bacterium]